MNSDFRLSTDFADSPKVEKAVRRLGEPSFRCIVRLQGWTARNRPDGLLRNLDQEDIAIAAGWTGDSSQFCQTLSDLRIIDWSEANQCFEIHDWREHNPWASEAGGRAEHARRLNHERWHVERNRVEPSCKLCSSNDIASDDQTSIRTDSDADSDTESSLRISTSPVVKEEKGSATAQQMDIKIILDLFPADYGHPLPTPTRVAKWIAEIGIEEARTLVSEKAAGQFAPNYITSCIVTRAGQIRNGINAKTANATGRRRSAGKDRSAPASGITLGKFKPRTAEEALASARSAPASGIVLGKFKPRTVD